MNWKGYKNCVTRTSNTMVASEAFVNNLNTSQYSLKIIKNCKCSDGTKGQWMNGKSEI